MGIATEAVRIPGRAAIPHPRTRPANGPATEAAPIPHPPSPIPAPIPSPNQRAAPNSRATFQPEMSSPFEVTLTESAGSVHVKLRGELDISTAPRLEEDLRRAEADGPAVIMVDLSGLDFMDSTGLRLLISADLRAREAGRRLVLVQGNEMVQRVLRLTRLDERLEIVDDPA